jgi:hypothetical protein
MEIPPKTLPNDKAVYLSGHYLVSRILLSPVHDRHLDYCLLSWIGVKSCIRSYAMHYHDETWRLAAWVRKRKLRENPSLGVDSLSQSIGPMALHPLGNCEIILRCISVSAPTIERLSQIGLV